MNINSIISLFVGKRCWLMVAGKGTGSIVNLGFGEKIRRERPIPNSCLTEQERKYDSELSIMISCAWRVSNPTRIICGWRDDNEHGGNMLSGLNMLRDKKILKVCVNDFRGDLDLHFEGDIIMSLFCDITNKYDVNENYYIRTPDIYFFVGLNSEIKVEARN